MPAVPRLHGRLGQGGSGEQWDQAQILDNKTQAKVKMIWTQQAMGHQARLRKILKPTELLQRCNKAITVIMQNI